MFMMTFKQNLDVIDSINTKIILQEELASMVNF